MSTKEVGKHPPTDSSVSEKQDRQSSDPDTYRHIRTDFLMGLLVTAILLCAKLPLERTWFGEQVNLGAYKWLQDQLSASFDQEHFPLQILDISNLPTASSPGALTPVTPRQRLFKLIQAVVAQKPVAVGVDIDFSPTSGGYRDPQNDPWFFQSVAELQKRSGVPVFLGIADNSASPPDEWLAKEYQDLAACILLPRADDRRIGRWIRVGQSRPGPMMCSALAESYPGRRSTKRVGPRWALQQSSIRQLPDDVYVDEFTIDYSALKTLEHDKLSTISPQSVGELGSHFKDKIVLIGDALLEKTTGGDSFPIPGKPGELYPGIYIHACATYTLLRNPLYEVTASGRFFLDVFLSVTVLGIVAAIRYHYAPVITRTVAARRLQIFFACLIALATLVGGYGLVALFRIFWDDFIVVAAALLLHAMLEPYLERFLRWARKAIPEGWNRLVFTR